MSRAPAQHQIVDATGAPVSGGKRYTYEGGTTTPKATWSDRAKSVPNTNPILADAAGILSSIYMTDGETYKFVDTDPDGVTIRTQDDFYSSSLTDSSLIVRIKQIASNPVDYGAVGDGVGEEHGAVQSAIDNATGVVDLLGLTFRCDSQITWPSGITIRNGTLDFSNCADDEFILAAGALENGSTLTSDAGLGDGSVALTTVSGLSSGDVCVLSDTQQYTDDIRRAELVEIESITGSTVYLTKPLLDECAVAEGASFGKLTTVDDLVLEHVTIIGAEGIAGTHAMVALHNCRRVTVENCDLRHIDSYGIQVAGCYDVVVEKCSFRNGITAVITSDVNHNVRAQRNTVVDCSAPFIVSTGATAVPAAPNGPSRFVVVTDNVIEYGGASTDPMISVDDTAQYVWVTNNKITRYGTGAAWGIVCSCVDAWVEGNTFYGIAAGADLSGINLTPKVPKRTGTHDYVLHASKNVCRTDGTLLAFTSAATTAGVIIGHLRINENEGTGNIVLNTGGTADNPDVTNFEIRGNVTDGVITLATTYHAPIDNLRITSNRATGLTVSGDSTGAVQKFLLLAHNDIEGNVSIAKPKSTATFQIIGGRTNGTTLLTDPKTVEIVGHTSLGAFKVNSGTVLCALTVTGGTYDTTALNGTAFEFSASVSGSSLRFSGGKFYSPNARALDVGGIVNRGNVSGCEFSAPLTDGIRLAGTGAGNMAGVKVAGNTFYDCAKGLVLSNGSNTSQFNNHFVGCTLDVEGVWGGGVHLYDGVSHTGVILKSRTFTIPAAEIKTLAGTPVVAIVGVPGKVHNFIQALLHLDYNTAAFAAGAACRFAYTMGDYASGAVATTLFTAAADRYLTVPPPTTAVGDEAGRVNEDIVFLNTGAEFTTGLGSLDITVIYTEIAVS